MNELKLVDRIVVEIKSEEGFELSQDQLRNELQFIISKITRGESGGSLIDQFGEKPEFEVLWEHECPEYGGFKIVGDKSLISQYYYHSELAPRIISEELNQRIRNYLDSFGDDLSDEEMAELFCQANALLSDVSQQTTIVI